MKLMHRFLLLAALAGSNAPAILAQEDELPPLSDERIKEIKAQKSAYITSKLGLTPEESQKFWPIYNEMDDKQEVIRKEMRDLHKGQKRDGQEMTEAEASQLLDKALANRQKELDLEKTYAEQFKKSIGAVKTVKLKKAERDFHREVLKKFRERMQERRDGARPGDGTGPGNGTGRQRR